MTKGIWGRAARESDLLRPLVAFANATIVALASAPSPNQRCTHHKDSEVTLQFGHDLKLTNPGWELLDRNIEEKLAEALVLRQGMATCPKLRGGRFGENRPSPQLPLASASQFEIAARD